MKTIYRNQLFLIILIGYFLLPMAALGESYISGRKWAQLKPVVVATENGSWIKVPANYLNPSLGETEIYYATTPNFDPKKPTVVFIQGGPGGSSHSKYRFFSKVAEEGRINIVIFDLRGVAFSRPETSELFLNSNIYNSNFVARDLVKIMDELKIKKWSVWGSSYGTVPATIFGSLFPERTQSVILEGTIFSKWPSYQNSVYIANVLNTRLFNKLNARGRAVYNTFDIFLTDIIMESMRILGSLAFDEIAKVLNRSEISAKAEQGFDEIYYETHRDRIVVDVAKAIVRTSALQNGLSLTNEAIYERAKLLVNRAALDEFLLDGTVYTMFTSNEAGSAYGQNQIQYHKDQGFTSTTDNSSYNSSFDYSNYQAKDYPLTVPTIYFQGVADHATPFPATAEHYKQVAKGQKQLLVFNEGGHGPNLTYLSILDKEWIKNVFVPAVKGQQLTQADIEKFNTDQGKTVVLAEPDTQKLRCEDLFKAI